MKSWRTNLLVLLAFALVGLLLRWCSPPAVPELDKPLEPMTIAEARPELQPEDPTPEPPRPPVQKEVLVEATETLAAEQGLGWIRCDLGGLELEDARVTGAFERADVVGGTLVATVRSPTGRTTVHATLSSADRADPIRAIQRQVENEQHPLVGITWSGADQGRQGSCEVQRLESILVSGVVVDESGRPFLDPVSVFGCGALTAPIVDGQFEARWFADLPCTLTAVVRVGSREGTGPPLTVSGTTDVTGVRLEAPAELLTTLERRRERQEEARIRLEELLSADDVLDRAYRVPGLSPDARALIERRMTARDRAIDRLQEVVERELPESEPEEEEPELDPLIWNDLLPESSEAPG